jgi:hypothetical protein
MQCQLLECVYGRTFAYNLMSLSDVIIMAQLSWYML